MRVLTVILDRTQGDGAWVVVESGLRQSSLRHAEIELAIEEAKAIARRGHRGGDPRDVRINHREGHLLVTAESPVASHASPTP